MVEIKACEHSSVQTYKCKKTRQQHPSVCMCGYQIVLRVSLEKGA